MMRLRGAVAVLAVLASASAAQAHHSIAAVYDRQRAVVIDGRVTEVEIMNPHSKLRVEITSANGAPATWTLESSSSAGMQRQGLTTKTIGIGERVKAIAYPARSGAREGWLTRLETDDRVYDLSVRSTTAPKPEPAF